MNENIRNSVHPRPSHTCSCLGHIKEEIISVVKVLELLAESEESWEDAARQAVAEASKTARGISSVYISELQATVENNQIKNYRANVKISFVLESSKS